MGLLAWVLDALISWHFFPGRTFYEMLFNYDPERTLYVRSTVVMLFFVFGLMAGKLVSNLEQTQGKLERNLKLVDGIRRFHALIVNVEDEPALTESVLPVLSEAFGMNSLGFIRMEGDPPLKVSEYGSSGHRDWESVHRELENKREMLVSGEELHWINGIQQDEAFLAPVRLGDRFFGVIYGEVPFPNPFNSTGHMEHFLEVCDNLGHALAHLEDLEERKRNAEKLSNLYNNAPVGIFTSNPKGKLLFINTSMSRLLGAENPEQILSADLLAGGFYVDPSRRDLFLQTLKQDGFIGDFEVDIMGLDQKVRTLLLAARLNNDQGTEESTIDGFAMDITKSKAAERENRILQKQLTKSQHFRSITVLAGGVAHEFNNILQAMMGSAYLAQMRYSKKEDEIWNYLQDIQSSGKRAAKLCDQMLSYAGKKAMLLKQDNPETTLVDILKIIRSDAGSGVKFENHFHAPQAQVRMDVPSFSEIVNQLVTNAVESFPDGRGQVTLSTCIRKLSLQDFDSYQMSRNISPDEYWELKIEDNGSGISSEDLPRIFEPFYTTKFQGRGLGLPSIAGLVEKFDGSLGVRSRKPEQGTEVALWLPLAEAVLIEDTEPEIETVEKKELKGSGKIFVVDDEPLICMTIQRLLTRSGYEILTANDGIEALEKIQAEDPEDIRCLILDVTMPRMGGLETLQNIREFLPDLPVLIMSGYDESDSLENFKDLNVEGFIHKPFRMEMLENRLMQVLG